MIFPLKRNDIQYFSYHFWLFMRFCVHFFFNEMQMLFVKENTQTKKALTSELFQEVIALYYPLTFSPNVPFSLHRNGIIVCNHVHSTLDIFSLQHLGHLFNIPLTFVGYIDFKAKMVTQPIKMCIGLQNMPYHLSNSSNDVIWDTSLSTWITRRANYISLDWDKENNRPVQGSYTCLREKGTEVLNKDGFIVGFPEGCYDGTYSEKPFYPGFFRLAVETKKPIYSFVLVYRDVTTKRLLKRQKIKQCKQVECYLALHSVIETEFIRDEKEAMKIAHQMTQKQLDWLKFH